VSSRPCVHALQFALRTELLACNSAKKFWDFVPKRTDPRPKKAKVTVKDSSVDFEARLNFPKVPPASFNTDQLAFNARMSKNLPPPPDSSPRQSYTRDITIEEIEKMKRHIRLMGLTLRWASIDSHTKTVWQSLTRNFWNSSYIVSRIKTCLVSG
jgi:hypothetical protein